MRAQNRTLTGALPLDRPTPDRPFRLYVATTNHCNRACPWCCTCSSPSGETFLAPAALSEAWPTEGAFEVQLEGGEPTVHPELWTLVALARAEPRCTRLVVVSNGVAFPRDASLVDYLARFGAPFTLKLSVNHYLLEHDPGLLELAQAIAAVFRGDPGDRQLVLNVRLRPRLDQEVEAAVEAAGLLPWANVFELQRYGFAAEEPWAPPFLVGDRFQMLNPDGTLVGTDLIARSEAMRVLP